MFTTRKFVSMILCAVLFLSMPLTAYAAGPETLHKDLEEYFEFIVDPERMNADGTFTFGFREELSSDHFIANSNKITISAKGYKFDVNHGSVEHTKSYKYTITLYKIGTGEEVDSYSGYANNRSKSHSFAVEKGQEYYFIMTCEPALSMPYSLKGTGKVTDVTVKYD